MILKCEWDNWTEGSIEEPANFIQVIADNNGLSVSEEWRWFECDEKP